MPLRRDKMTRRLSMNRNRACPGALTLAGVLIFLWGCKTLPPPTLPDNAGLHNRADYARGGGAAAYLHRIERNDARAAFLAELDGYLHLLRRLVSARARTSALVLPS